MFLVLLISLSTMLSAQENIIKKASIKVFGNCGLCKARIENALNIKEVKSVAWNKKTKMLSVAYLSPAITTDSLQQRIAAVGHDTEKFKAPDAVYNTLDECCQYRDGSTAH
jgi:mercuric ion binding protein